MENLTQIERTIIELIRQLDEYQLQDVLRILEALSRCSVRDS